jgi:hypothetical protein
MSTEEGEKKTLECIYVRTIKYRNSTKREKKKERSVQSNNSRKKKRQIVENHKEEEKMNACERILSIEYE